MRLPFRSSNLAALAVVGLLLTLLPTSPVLRQTQWYVDVNDATCGDVPGKGTKADPYCQVKYAATVAVPGDTFDIQAGLYGATGQTIFTKSGTSANPITYRGVGDVRFGLDLADDTFTAAPGLANVYRVAYTGDPGTIAQLKWDPILVDDPNASIFTMIPEDGPLRLNEVFNDTDLVAHEGTWRLVSGTPAMLYVHAYGHRVVSTAATDLVAGGSGFTNFITQTGVQYNVYENVRVWFTWTILGSNNTFRNMQFQTAQFNLQGANNTIDGLMATHGITRTPAQGWSWDEGATGGGILFIGPNHVGRNIQIYHNWNSGVTNAEAGNLVIENIIARAAPNHCSVAGDGNAIVRNVLMYNCQDYVWLHDTNSFTYEHLTVPSGVGVESLQSAGSPVGPVIIRNSIFSGSFVFIRGELTNCSWKDSVVENSVITTTATIEVCGPVAGNNVPIATYMANCASGKYTDCITFRNNIMVDPTAWKTVLADGMWNGSLGDNWNAQLVAGSPAIDLGTTSGATTDLIGITRPQGKAKDAGAYEFTVSTPLPATGLVVGAQAQVVTTITAPTSATTYDAGTSATLTTLAGTSKSSRPITGCTWINSLGGSGAASGGTSWTVGSIPLTVGSNVISVTCTNEGKTANADTITVTRSSGGGGANPIAANRLPDGDTAIPNPTWAAAGATIVNRTTQCGSTIAAGASITTLNAAITACPANQFVLLGAGSFSFASSINMKSNVTVRGSGANSTLITFTGGGCTFQGHVCFDGDGATYMNNPRFSTNWTAGYTRGTTQITLADASNVAVGYVLFLDQLDNSTTDPYPVPWYCEVQITCVVQGIDKGGGSRDGRFHHQEVRVTAKSGNLVTVTPAIIHTTWSSGRDPEAWFGNATITGAGLENLSLQGSGSTNHIISMTGATNSWVKGVRSMGPARSHVWMQIATHLTIRDSYFFNTASHASQSYGVEHMGASSNLIENNIFQYVTAPIVFNGGVGSVVGYNFTVNNVYDSVPTHEFLFGGLWTHAGGVDYNLWEGNDTPGYQSDVQHAGSNFQTLLRNYLWGRERTQQQNTNPIYTRAQNRFHNILGNVLGITGYHTQYEFTPTSGGNQHLSIYQLGVGYTGDGPANDANVKNSLLRWGNWDVVTSTADATSGDQTGVRWCGNASSTGWSTRCGSASEVPSGIAGNFANPIPSAETVPTSLYLSAKPAFFGSVTWPAIGPDVSGGAIANLGGHVHAIPARTCYFTTMGGTLTGTTALPFTCTY